MLPYLIFGATYGFAAGVQPGPFSTFLISQSLARGWRRTIPAAFAPLISDGPIATLTIVVLSAVPSGMVNWLRIIGGVFILYLAYGAWRSSRYYVPVLTADAASTPVAERGVLKAAFVNLLNPNPYIAWSLVLGPTLLKGWRETPSHGLAFLLSFYMAMTATFLAIVLVFSIARKLGPGLTKAMIGISALALCAFGVYQLWVGIAARF